MVDGACSVLPTRGRLAYWFSDLCTQSGGAAGGSGSVTHANWAGKIALIKRGVCEFGEKAFRAQNAQAIAVVVYNNVAADGTVMVRLSKAAGGVVAVAGLGDAMA